MLGEGYFLGGGAHASVNTPIGCSSMMCACATARAYGAKPVIRFDICNKNIDKLNLLCNVTYINVALTVAMATLSVPTFKVH